MAALHAGLRSVLHCITVLESSLLDLLPPPSSMSQVSFLPAPSTLPSCAPVSDHAQGRARPSVAQTPSLAAADVYSVFDVLNVFCARWFVNCAHILSLALFAQKAGEGNEVTWVKFSPQSHSHLVKQALALAPPSYPLTLVKRVIFSFILEVVNSPDSSLGQFTKALAPRHCRHASTPAPSQLPAPSGGLVRASRPSALDPMPTVILPSSLMAVDSPSPPPSDLSPLSPTPMPRALDFAASAVGPPPMVHPPLTPEPPAPSSPSLSASSGTSDYKRSKVSARKSTSLVGRKRPLDPLSPSYESPADARAILVPSSEPGQQWTQPSLVAYRAALRDLRVRARIDVAEELTLAEDAALHLPLRELGPEMRRLGRLIGDPSYGHSVR